MGRPALFKGFPEIFFCWSFGGLVSPGRCRRIEPL